MIAKTLNSSSQSSIIINHKIPAHVGVCLTTLRMMQVIKLASSTEFNSSSSSIIINHKIPVHVGVCLTTLRMMQVIKLASSTEFATKIRKVSNFCTEVIHFKLEALPLFYF